MDDQYSFGPFTLDAAEHRLYADGVSVPLGSTDLRLLLALVQQAGAVVSKDDLMSRVWGRTAVSDNVLYVHINALRRTLGDECIVNKQGRGYRFVAPVQRTDLHARLTHAEARPGNLPSLWTTDQKKGPSRLIGRRLRVHLHADVVELESRGAQVAVMERLARLDREQDRLGHSRRDRLQAIASDTAPRLAGVSESIDLGNYLYDDKGLPR